MFVGLAQAGLFPFIYLVFIILYVCVYLHIFITYVCLEKTGRKRALDSPRTGITYGCKLKYGVLRTKLGSPARAVSALSC